MKWKRFESEVKRSLEQLGFAVFRCCGSSPVDLVCLKKGFPPVLVECKYGTRPTLSKNQRERLLKLRNEIGGLLLLARRKRYSRTRFYLLEEDSEIALRDLLELFVLRKQLHSSTRQS